MREFLTVHFVADELRRRGVPVRHLHVWDDYDRFRKVPAGVDPSYADHIGRPLSAVPDPWDCHPSWAEHFKEPLVDALHAMGIEMEEVSQTERYTSGLYREQVLLAVRHRHDIEAVLARYRTKKTCAEPVSDQEADALADSVADDEDPEGATELERFPYKPYCRTCQRDTTTVTAYDDATTDLTYSCDRGHTHTTNLATQDEGKLVWKVDWPMRWAFEHVDFEPAGMDHATPGSSFTRRPRAGREGLRDAAAGVVRLRLRRLRGSAEDVVVRGWRTHRRGRVAGAGGADRALALRAPQPQADLRHRLRARGRAALRRVGLPDPQGRRPRQARRPGARLGTGLRDGLGPAAGAAGRRTLPAAVLGRRRHRGLGRADQPHRRSRGRRPPAAADKAMAWTSEYVDPADRTNVRATPDEATLASLSDAAARVAAAAARRTARPARPRPR